MTREEYKAWAKENNSVKLVTELVTAGYDLDYALEYVYDAKKLSKDEFRTKYFG